MKIFNSSMGKRVFLVLLLLCTITAISFAQPTTSDAFGLNSKVKILVDLVNSPWVKGIAFIALVVECIAMITAGRQEPGMFKKFVPWIAGTILFMAAGTITSKFLNISTTTATSTSTELGLD